METVPFSPTYVLLNWSKLGASVLSLLGQIQNNYSEPKQTLNHSFNRVQLGLRPSAKALFPPTRTAMALPTANQRPVLVFLFGTLHLHSFGHHFGLSLCLLQHKIRLLISQIKINKKVKKQKE